MTRAPLRALGNRLEAVFLFEECTGTLTYEYALGNQPRVAIRVEESANKQKR